MSDQPMSQYLIAHIGHSTKWCEHITWWAPDSKGYRVSIEKAGLYSEAEAKSICQWGSCIAVKKEDAQPLSMPTPYYRRQDGRLDRMYDGGEHVVVPNTGQAWAHLMRHRLDFGKTEKPTPISPAKARAAYLPTSEPQQEGQPS
jgi:hypothetical protein